MDLEKWAGLGSTLASLMFIYSVVTRFVPVQSIEAYLTRHVQKLIGGLYPYVQITIPEYSTAHMKRNEAFTAIESYLSSSCSRQATKLKADFGNDSNILLLSLDDHEEVADDFLGAKLWWSSFSVTPPPTSGSHYSAPEARRYYKLTFHKSKRDSVISDYMKHVMERGIEISMHNRQRKIYTNKSTTSSSFYGGYDGTSFFWNHLVFEHPSTFDTVAMDPTKKKEILDDLDTFRRGKEYYAKIGKAWKRGYLLYGPPGTGKSTLVAAIANYMEYDIYDLELTTVTTNTELRRMLIETTSKSIILIEDIDCSLELTGKRRKKKDQNEESNEDITTKVTLSGLLNFIDGLWSVSAGERLIVFTTNHVEKLDPALIRRGRMDKHIEMPYCGFEAFKVLAKNYLEVDESHRLFREIRELMEEVEITTADVAENLMPGSVEDDADTCLGSLVRTLRKVKEESVVMKSSSRRDDRGGIEEEEDDEPINLIG